MRTSSNTKFDILATEYKKITVVRDVTPYSLVNISVRTLASILVEITRNKATKVAT